MTSRSRRLWIVLGLIAGSPVLLCATVVVVYRIGVGRTANSLPNELDSARREGILVDVPQIRQLSPAVKPEENAGGIYRDAATRLADRDSEWWGLTYSVREFLAGRSSPKDEADLRKKIALADPALSLSIKASQKPRLDWGRHWEQGTNLVLDGYDKVRDLGKCLCARAILRAKTGQVDDALRDVEAAFRIASQLGQEPTIESLQAELSLEGDCQDALAEVVNRPAATTAHIDRAIQMVQSLRNLPSLRSALAVDVCLLCHTLATAGPNTRIEELSAYAHDETSTHWYDRDPSDWFGSRAFRDAWAAKAIHIMRRCLAAVPAREPTFADLSAASQRLEDDLQNDSSLENKQNGHFFPQFSETASQYTQIVAGRRMLAQCLAIKRARSTTGKLPSALPLGGESSVDPYDLKPLHYRLMGRGFRVYSVGPDQIDDGGATYGEVKGARTFDLAQKCWSDPSGGTPCAPSGLVSSRFE